MSCSINIYPRNKRKTEKKRAGRRIRTPVPTKGTGPEPVAFDHSAIPACSVIIPELIVVLIIFR